MIENYVLYIEASGFPATPFIISFSEHSHALLHLLKPVPQVVLRDYEMQTAACCNHVAPLAPLICRSAPNVLRA
jgi:hypothetical protein